MAFLLDTNAWITYLRQRSSPLVARMEAAAPEELLLCSVVVAELLFGAARSTRSTENLALIERLIERFDSLPFDDRAAHEYYGIRLALERAGTPIGPHDTMIAAIARANDLTLVTHNTSQFGRIERLIIEDWESAGSSEP